MRILFAVHGYKPAFRVGGPIISVSSLAEALVAKGHEVVVFTTNSNLDQDLDVPLDQPICVDGVEVWYFRRQEFFRKWMPFLPYLAKSSGFVYAPRMKSCLDSMVQSVDLVHTHLPFIFPTYAAAHSAFRNGKPLFYHQRGVFDPARLRFRSLKKKFYLNAIELPILRRVNTLIALTASEVSSYRELGLTIPCRVVPNGVTVTDLKSTAPSLLGIPNDAQVVLFLGRLHPTKGAEILLRSFAAIRDRVPKALLVLAGPDEFGLETQFNAMAKASGLSRRVIFPGMVSGEAKLQLLQRADLFCLPSMGEGFSIAVLEALANATPVLLSPGCHFPEVVNAGVGVIAEPRVLDFGNAMVNLLSNPEDLKKMGTAGRRFVQDNYSWSTIADRMIEVYEDGLDRHRLAVTAQ
jgi:glycosyltransferase involved in cell wall biosynthesis